MSESPLVSIIMPVYNREKTLEESVKSIFEQSYSNWELIIVDDNSTDGSLNLIKTLSEQDHRISYKINTEYSHSCAGARLSGLKGIKGSYVSFLDSDDTWPIYHLKELLDYLENNADVDFVFGDLQRIDENSKVVVGSKFEDEKGLPKELLIKWKGDFGQLSGRDNLAIAILRRFNTGMHTAMYREVFLKDINLRDVYGCEDALLTLEALYKNAKIAVHNKIHLNYLVHGGNVSSVNPDMTFEQTEKNVMSEINFYQTLIPNYLKELNVFEEQARKKKLAELYVWHLGNGTYRKFGKSKLALGAIFSGIKLDPTNWRYYKTFLANVLGA